MKWPAAICFSIVSFTSLFYGIVPAKAPAPGWFSVGLSSLRVTEGVIKEAERNRPSVDVPKMRAYVPDGRRRPSRRASLILAQQPSKRRSLPVRSGGSLDLNCAPRTGVT